MCIFFDNFFEIFQGNFCYRGQQSPLSAYADIPPC